ncbi:SDR family oxidoreductase [Pseudomonas serboccidentalis]|uniref:SDR family oxidoreductase n=1 Tax=Pseudomonas serboccidentalis TaxID=2964670 RepID=A0ABY7Z6E9_9PSED|nr:SDR family NAD(P)-dependent oxidoreductase [Pseudomonas serboccidentalis]WDR34992.1 SDR family oxidoreductase [Pseudomonas serboccidentalis]
MNFNAKIALVVGGTRGIGFDVSQKLIDAGCICYITGRNEDDGLTAQSRLGENCTFIKSDVTDEASVIELFRIINDKHGRLDLAVNNAGVTSRHAPIRDMDFPDWKRVLEINLLGPLLLLKHETNLISRHAGGSIVNVSSCAGLLGVAKQSAYSTSKAALNMLTQVCAIECAEEALPERHSIRVNAVCPGPTLGGMNSEERLKANPESTKHKLQVTAMKRFANPGEISAAILWLLSDASSFVTGTVMPVDGGFSAGKF